MKEHFVLTTGAPAFEQLFYGTGIRVHPKEGTSILIEGAAGLGKTTLALQLTAKAVEDDHASCIYYTFEQTTRELRDMIDAFGWPIDAKEAPWESGQEPVLAEKFNVIDAHSQIGLNVTKTLDSIEGHAKNLAKKFESLAPIVVLDSLGAIKDLVDLEREHLGRLIERLSEWRAILVLVREKDGPHAAAKSEYMTTTVIDLQADRSYFVPSNELMGLSFAASIPRSMMELKKTRNQSAHRGPHEFRIVPGTREKPGGFVVYPSLQSVATRREDLDEGKLQKPLANDRACFGLQRLDVQLGDASLELEGMPFGQSLLVKGTPGSYKTQLGVQFLLQALPYDEDVLFVSCRIDRSALEDLEIYRDDDQRRLFIRDRLRFIDARHPYRTPEQVMARIMEATEGGSRRRIRRAVIFGIGMLDTLPAFQRNAMPFLQVLIGYFRRERMSGVFIDWPHPHEERSRSPQLVRPTELAGDFVAGAIEVVRDSEQDGHGGPTERRMILKRKNHRFVNVPLGEFRLEPPNLVIEEIASGRDH